MIGFGFLFACDVTNMFKMQLRSNSPRTDLVTDVAQIWWRRDMNLIHRNDRKESEPFETDNK